MPIVSYMNIISFYFSVEIRFSYKTNRKYL